MNDDNLSRHVNCDVVMYGHGCCGCWLGAAIYAIIFEF